MQFPTIPQNYDINELLSHRYRNGLLRGGSVTQELYRRLKTDFKSIQGMKIPVSQAPNTLNRVFSGKGSIGIPEIPEIPEIGREGDGISNTSRNSRELPLSSPLSLL